MKDKLILLISIIALIAFTGCKKCKDCTTTVTVTTDQIGLPNPEPTIITEPDVCGDDLKAIDGKTQTTTYESGGHVTKVTKKTVCI